MNEQFSFKTKKEYSNLSQAVPKLRNAFAQTFSMHYCSLLLKNEHGFEDLIKNAGIRDLVNQAQELAKNPNMGPQYQAIEAAIQRIIFKYYSDAFAEEENYLYVWKNLDYLAFSAKEILESQKSKLTEAVYKECHDYLQDITNKKRVLIETNFIALENQHGEMFSVILAHVYAKPNSSRTIVHVRQAYSVTKGMGHLTLLANKLVELYPQAKLEFQKRRANVVPMFDVWEKANLLVEAKCTLFGYNPEKYVRFKTSTDKTLLTASQDYFLWKNKPSNNNVENDINEHSNKDAIEFG